MGERRAPTSVDAPIPGLMAKHAVITASSRRRHGERTAFDLAMVKLQQEYADLLDLRSDRDELDFHLVLTVEKKR